MALRLSLEGQTLPGELQDLSTDGSQKGRSARARAVTGRRSFSVEQKSFNAGMPTACDVCCFAQHSSGLWKVILHHYPANPATSDSLASRTAFLTGWSRCRRTVRRRSQPEDITGWAGNSWSPHPSLVPGLWAWPTSRILSGNLTQLAATATMQLCKRGKLNLDARCKTSVRRFRSRG
jgi:hypothetical protein